MNLEKKSAGKPKPLAVIVGASGLPTIIFRPDNPARDNAALHAVAPDLRAIVTLAVIVTVLREVPMTFDEVFQIL